MNTVLFSRKRPDGIRLITVLNVEDYAMDNFADSITTAVQMFEESWDRPITTLEEVGEELEHYGITIVENVSIFEVDDDKFFQNYELPFKRVQLTSNAPIQISEAPPEDEEE